MRVPFAIKSVARRMGRYGFLVAMTAFGIAAVTLVQSVTVGMNANVIEGSARYLGGRYLVIARSAHGWAENRMAKPDELTAAVRDAGLAPRLVIKRQIAGDNDQTLFFNGASFKVRRISGIDASNEASVFEKITFVAGGTSGLPGTAGILISKQVADRFGVRLGDEITLRLVNSAGYIDSANLVVQGIFKDASIFGFYNCYVDAGLLGRLKAESEGAASILGFYFSGRENESETAAAIRSALAVAGYELMPGVERRDDLDAVWGKEWKGTRYAVLPVEEYIDAKVMDLIRAIQVISYVFLGFILLIILVGMRNTTQIMTRKRFKEIGTARALGMTRGGALRLILSESLLVATIGFAAGVVAAVIILGMLQTLPFSWSDGFDIFLKRGRITWILSLPFLAANYGALGLMTLAGALPAARRASTISPAVAMSTIE